MSRSAKLLHKRSKEKHWTRPCSSSTRGVGVYISFSPGVWMNDVMLMPPSWVLLDCYDKFMEVVTLHGLRYWLHIESRYYIMVHLECCIFTLAYGLWYRGCSILTFKIFTYSGWYMQVSKVRALNLRLHKNFKIDHVFTNCFTVFHQKQTTEVSAHCDEMH